MARLIRPPALAAVLAAAVAASGLTSGAWTAGGSDSYGYVSQAALWRSGALDVPVPLADEVPWPHGRETFAPLGYRGSRDRAAVVPIYPPGLPMLMAVAQAVAGFCAAFWVAPLSGALFVWLTFALGRRLGGDAVGLAAAWFVATSPVLLFMVMSPMSDVPAAAAWTLAIVLALGAGSGRALGAGLAASLAVLIRPNLVPLGGIAFAWLAWRAWRGRHESGGWRPGPALAFLAGMTPGVAAVAWLNAHWYGSAFESGYGGLDYLVSTSAVADNLARYGAWFTGTQTPLALIGVAAIALPAARLWGGGTGREGAVLLAGVAFGTLALYCLYFPFDDWWYLRFLLPAWPAVFVGLAVVLSRLWTSPRLVLRAAGVFAALALGVATLDVSRERRVFASAAAEPRYAEAARFVRERTEDASVILSMQHSGTLRLYGGRTSLRFDWLSETWLDRAVEWLHASGRRPYILLEEWERERFRDRFAAGNRLGALDVRLVFVYRHPDAAPIYLYDPLGSPGDPPALLAGESPPHRCAPPAGNAGRAP